jgi:hypothetical protein
VSPNPPLDPMPCTEYFPKSIESAGQHDTIYTLRSNMAGYFVHKYCRGVATTLPLRRGKNEPTYSLPRLFIGHSRAGRPANSWQFMAIRESSACDVTSEGSLHRVSPMFQTLCLCKRRVGEAVHVHLQMQLHRSMAARRREVCSSRRCACSVHMSGLSSTAERRRSRGFNRTILVFVVGQQVSKHISPSPSVPLSRSLARGGDQGTEPLGKPSERGREWLDIAARGSVQPG